MSSRLLPELGTPEANDLITEYETCSLEGVNELSQKYGYKNYDSFQVNMFKRLGARRKVRPSPKKLYNNPEVIMTDGLLVFADVQMPFHDADFMNRCLDVANEWGIKDGVTAGDFLNMSAFSIFIHKPKDKIWEEERDYSIDTMRAMREAVERWLMLLGNHEAFLIKTLAEQLGMDDILKLLGKLRGFRATEYYYCKAIVAGEEWRISHPRNISTIHGRVAARLANKLGANVISAHGHLFGIAPSENGQYVGIDSGVCCEPLALDYASQRDTLRPAMNKAVVILKKGEDDKCHYYVLRPDSDWNTLRRLYR